MLKLKRKLWNCNCKSHKIGIEKLCDDYFWIGIYNLVPKKQLMSDVILSPTQIKNIIKCLK